MVVYSLNPGGFASRGDHSSSDPNFYTGHQGMGSENCPYLAGRPREVADSEMADLVPEDVQKVDVSGTTEDRGNSVPESDDFDGDGFVAGDGSVVVLSKFSEPYFLRSVLREELGGYVSGYALLATAVHAVMQESGFAAVDPVTGMPADQLHLAEQRPRLAVWYSLPKLVARSDSLNMREGVLLNMPEGVLLTFRWQGLGLAVSGYLLKGKGVKAVRRLRLDGPRFARTMWAIGHGNDPEANAHSISLNSYHAKEVLEFWKLVKDGLALPLLIRLTKRVRLPLPSCFMCLPKELKLKIFESLPGIDLLRVGRVCSELRLLTSNNDLWKQKHVEEFGMPNESSRITNWKQRFACELDRRRRWRVVAYGSIGFRQTARYR